MGAEALGCQISAASPVEVRPELLEVDPELPPVPLEPLLLDAPLLEPPPLALVPPPLDPADAAPLLVPELPLLLDAALAPPASSPVMVVELDPAPQAAATKAKPSAVTGAFCTDEVYARSSTTVARA